MTPLPVINGVSRCTFHWSGEAGADHPVSVQHFMGSWGNQADLAAQLDANTQTHQFEGLKDSILVATVDILDLDGTAGTQSYSLSNWAGESGSGVDPLEGLAIMVEGQTGLRGQANRGRLFLPSPAESIVTGGLLDAANASDISDAWNDFNAAMTTAGIGWQWGVASYVHGTFHPYTAIKVPRRLGRIRRRQPH